MDKDMKCDASQWSLQYSCKIVYYSRYIKF